MENETGGKFRKRKRSNFTQIPNSLLTNNTISAAAKGLYCLIALNLDKMENIPNFTVYKTTIQNQCKEGRDAFEHYWKELKSNGYLIVHRTHTSNHFEYEYELLDEPKEEGVINGPFSNYGFSVCRKPAPENPTTDNQDNDNSEDGKSVEYNNNLEINKRDNNTNNNNVVVDKDMFLNKIKEDIERYIEAKIIDEDSAYKTIDKIISLALTLSNKEKELFNNLSINECSDIFFTSLDVYNYVKVEALKIISHQIINKDAYIIGILKNKCYVNN